MTWFPKEKVLVPVDFSDHAFSAVDTALELASQPSGVFAVHVLPDLSAGEPGEMWHTVDDSSRRQHATKALREKLSDTRYADLHVEILFGDPGHEIARFAKQQNIELIVMPSHGRTGLKHLLIGSVAERVMRLAHCPVLVLRT